MTRGTKGRKPLSGQEVEAVRAEILAAARRLFTQKGYRAVSMRALAEATGMSAMALYRYFDGRRAILIHIWADTFTRVFQGCRLAAGACDGPDEALRAYAAAFVGYWVDNPENYMMVYTEIDEPVSGESFFADSDVVAAELAFMTDLLIACGVPRDDLALTLQQLICAMHGVCHSLVTIPEMRWLPHESLIRGLVDGLLGKRPEGKGMS